MAAEAEAAEHTELLTVVLPDWRAAAAPMAHPSATQEPPARADSRPARPARPGAAVGADCAEGAPSASLSGAETARVVQELELKSPYNVEQFRDLGSTTHLGLGGGWLGAAQGADDAERGAGAGGNRVAARGDGSGGAVGAVGLGCWPC